MTSDKFSAALMTKPVAVWFGTSPDFRLNLRKIYELRLAQQEGGDLVKRLPTRAGLRTQAR